VDGGAMYYMDKSDDPNDELLDCRLVCSWSTTDEEIDQFVALAKG
jgi:threonine aldolase